MRHTFDALMQVLPQGMPFRQLRCAPAGEVTALTATMTLRLNARTLNSI
jgi:hypothetical protein